jgi:hypothetical protein
MNTLSEMSIVCCHGTADRVNTSTYALIKPHFLRKKKPLGLGEGGWQEGARDHGTGYCQLPQTPKKKGSFAPHKRCGATPCPVIVQRSAFILISSKRATTKIWELVE